MSCTHSYPWKSTKKAPQPRLRVIGRNILPRSPRWNDLWARCKKTRACKQHEGIERRGFDRKSRLVGRWPNHGT